MSAPLVGHVVAPFTPVGVGLFLICLMGVFAGIHLLRMRLGRGRILGAAVTLLCLGGLIGDQIAGAGATTRSPVTVSVTVPARSVQTSPLSLALCGTDPNGRPAALPANPWLLVRVDGSQVTETRQHRLELFLSAGRHQIMVELLTADHREYQPATIALTNVDVAGTGSLAKPRGCPA